MSNASSSARGISRRRFIAAGAAAAVLPMVWRIGPARAAKSLKIGHLTPQTGPLAAFGEPVPFVLKQIEEAFKDGIEIGGETYAIEILNRDTQSNPNRASEVAADLILRDKVDIIVASSTFETVNPVADQAEVNGVPCITADCPWQPYVFGRNGDPKVGFEWTYHFFWGLEDATQSYVGLWKSVDTNKVVGGLFPNDADGNAWGDPELPGALTKTCERNGFKLVDGGRFPPGIEDYSAQITAFKKAGVEIVSGVLTPPDFGVFWQQCAQAQFQPKVVTVAKALLFPSVIEAIGPRADGLSTEIWWSPAHPYASKATGKTSGALCADYEKETGRPWTQPMGFKYALLEVAIDVLKRSQDVTDPKSILDAIRSTDYASIVGRIKWDNPDLKNICKTPVVSGQWVKKDKGFDLVICDNSSAPDVPVQGKLRLLG